MWYGASMQFATVAQCSLKERTRALIVIERTTRLGDIIATGTLVDASPSAELIRNIFFQEFSAA